ncbi:uncharacterized protein ACB058_017738 [Synchiropus picturatus]
MEGRHSVLLLYVPIKEFNNISLYFPKRQVPSFKYKSRAPHSELPSNDHDLGKEDHAVSKQRDQSSISSSKLLASGQARTAAVAELCWLAAENYQLLADILSLCQDCANKIKMGNQDGKMPESTNSSEVLSGSQDVLELQRGSMKNRKLKKSDVQTLDDPEESQRKRKMCLTLENNGEKFTCATTKPILPMDEPFQISREEWSFMDDNRTFEPDIDFCNNFSEFDGEQGFQSSSCSLFEGSTRRESGSNLRPMKRSDSHVENQTNTSAQQLYNQINQRDAGVRVVARVQEVDVRMQNVGQDCQRQSRDNQNGFNGEKTHCKNSNGLWLPLSRTTEPNLPGRPPKKSPSSPSLASVFNTSFPSSNCLQSMSPGLSPLSSKQTSPQLNHRILVLSDKDTDPDSSHNTDEPKLFSEVIDRNGNKRTLTRLELNLSRRPSNSKWNSTSTSTTTEDSLVRQDDIWMLDGDDPPDTLSCVPRPEHLDFLRITPPEDDIIEDTPYYPKLECMQPFSS